MRRTSNEEVPDTTPGSSDPSSGPPRREYRGTGVFWILVALFVPLALIIVLLAQNADPIPFRFLWIEAEPPLFVILLVTAALGAVVMESAAAAWRHQRRRTRTEHDELERLRAAQRG